MKGPFFEELHREIISLGGYHNAHLHLCRAESMNETKQALADAAESHLSISAKHGLIPVIHGCGTFSRKRFFERMESVLNAMIDSGTTRADTLVDVVSSTIGRTSFDWLHEWKNRLSDRLDLQLGTYCPLGFRNDEPERWNLVEQTSCQADFIGALPERDDKRMYPDHIGFRESIVRILDLSNRSNKPVHMHVDQKNDPDEKACEIAIGAIESMCSPWNDEPQVWFIHAISPSAYEEDRFEDLLRRMKATNTGVICCPSAAISMRQLREVRTPTHNSIARVLDFISHGIPVRIASDNINDITSPAGTADLMDEMFVLCNAIRFYDIPILARMASGKTLSNEQQQIVREHLEMDEIERLRAIQFTRSDIELMG